METLEHTVKVLSVEKLTHDVLQIVMEKPGDYTFIPGQATELSINSQYWREEKRAFTFTGLPEDPYLEMIIKTYPALKGVTNELLKLQPGNELIIREPWGAISYNGDGIFIAGGAGITPFISIFRHLASINRIKGNRLIFANKTKSDIILENKLKDLLGNNCINILSHEKVAGYHYGFITKPFLKDQIEAFDQKYYVCGPPPMMTAVTQSLSDLGVANDSVILEL